MFPANRCRCGIAVHVVHVAPSLQAFWAALPLRSSSTTAAKPAIHCRCGTTFMLHPLYRPSGRHCPSTSFPQRQQNPRFTAVVASPFMLHPLCRPSGRHCPSISFPQRQQNPRFTAVVALPFMLHPLYRPSGRHCPSTSFPQRQQNPRFTAVVASPFMSHRSCRTLSAGLLGGIAPPFLFHNGSKTRDSLPLWKGLCLPNCTFGKIFYLPDNIFRDNPE